MAVKKDTSEVSIVEVQRGRVAFAILGTTPLILQRMTQKVWHELLFPKGKKTVADKLSSIKHDMFEEFRSSPYRDSNPDGPTLLQHLASAFKGGMAGAATDVPGSSRAAIGRLVRVEGERISIYGVPKLFSSVVRSADMKQTPDVRTRVIVPEWACLVEITFAKPMINEQAVTNLLVSAGILQGLGDWRNGKGKGTYGSYTPVNTNDEDFKRILATGGREAQIEAMNNPEGYDEDTKDLMDWFNKEVAIRGKGDMLARSPVDAGDDAESDRELGRRVKQIKAPKANKSAETAV